MAAARRSPSANAKIRPLIRDNFSMSRDSRTQARIFRPVDAACSWAW
jgi:hypothetical protein